MVAFSLFFFLFHYRYSSGIRARGIADPSGNSGTGGGVPGMITMLALRWSFSDADCL
jgi:hypothetical protein